MSWRGRPVIHEIDTAAWLHDVGRVVGHDVTLADVPGDSWDAVCLPGVDAVWLMGVWERSPAARAVAVAGPNNLAEFQSVLPDLDVDADVMGSPYSVRRFVADARFGGPDGL